MLLTRVRTRHSTGNQEDAGRGQSCIGGCCVSTAQRAVDGQSSALFATGRLAATPGVVWLQCRVVSGSRRPHAPALSSPTARLHRKCMNCYLQHRCRGSSCSPRVNAQVEGTLEPTPILHSFRLSIRSPDVRRALGGLLLLVSYRPPAQMDRRQQPRQRRKHNNSLSTPAASGARL